MTFDHLPILPNEGLTLIVLNVIVHQLVQNWQIKKWDHGVGVVLGVEIRLPQQPPDEPIRLDSPRIVKLVVREVAVGMFSVAEEVDRSVADDARCNPPKCQVAKSLPGVSERGEDYNVYCELEETPELQILEDGFVNVVAARLHAPADACVIGGDAE